VSEIHDLDRFRGPWFNSRTAMAYVPCKSLNAWYQWRKRHGIVARSNGSVAKADLDKALKRPRRVTMRSASLANLLKSPTRLQKAG
jgi:hypothetical protein